MAEVCTLVLGSATDICRDLALYCTSTGGRLSVCVCLTEVIHQKPSETIVADVGAVIRFELIEGESTGKSDECANSDECLSASFYGSNYGSVVVQVRHQKSSKVQTL
jgi:hypothetical protein